MKPSHAIALAAVAFLLFPAAAQTGSAGSLVARVAPGDANLGKSLIISSTKVAFLDADGDSRIDSQPDETVYLDIAGDGKVSYGDIRLTRFGDYPAGSIVDITNQDLGIGLSSPSGWFATRQDAVATFDADFSGTLTVGDIRLDGTKVGPSDADLGTQTPFAQAAISSSQRTGFVDADGNGQHDVGEAIILDMDANSATGGRHVSEGDVQFVPTTFGSDDVVRRAEFDALKATPAGESGGVPASRGVSSFDWLLVALAVLNLAGLAYVVREVNNQRPKNPFR